MNASGGQAILEPRLVGDITGEFFVPAYQRGYRWGPDEVCRLLNDIWESGGQSYYLQPIVVKKYGSEWELVDGQQRLTTLYLMLEYMHREGLQSAGAGYSLRYATRPGSAEYLKKLDLEDAQSNLDFFHMRQAYDQIDSWFGRHEHRRQHAANRIYDALFERVKVIWYEAQEDVDATTLFTRLNVGRIPLTDAELVKALLLSRTRRASDDDDRTREIAAQWDAIEQQLHDPERWAFITGTHSQQPTRIGLFLDTLAGGPKGRDRPLFHTFETLKQRINSAPVDFWNEVIDLHSLVAGWFDDRNLFHKVGFLVSQGTTLDELIELANGSTKSGFEALLDARIQLRLNLSSQELEELAYGDTARATRALLLMNVETIRRREHSTERYSFSENAQGHWSLEHIHAQNAEKLNKAEQWEEWLVLQRDALLAMNGWDEPERTAAAISEVNEALSRKPITQSVFRPLEQELIHLLSNTREGNATDTDSITNLALLDSRDNSALGNSVFAVKRAVTIKRDRKGSYIPVCTRNIFLKYYTTGEDPQMHFWSDADRRGYLQALREVLDPYLVQESSSS